jgi:S1-C subfamily serine protease
MNELNKNQLILLTLLVSFVTSIGTGIITVALLQEAPSGVTQVINRVVERTIEQVTPAGNTGGAVVKDKQVTVVVKEEDQVIGAISKNAKSILRIRDNALIDGVSVFYGMGILVNKDGTVISGSRDSANTATTYLATFPDGSSYTMKYIGGEKGISVFKIAIDPRTPLNSEPATLSSAVPQLGQSAITLDGTDKNTVSIGRITGIADTAEGSKDLGFIETDILSKAKTIGGPLLNLSGEIIGIRTSFNDENQSFISASVMQKVLGNFLKK